MDISTIAGLIAFAALIFFGVASGQLTESLFNLHGIFVVVGGSVVAMLLNTPLRYIVRSATELRRLMLDDEAANLQRLIPVLTGLAEQCRMRGLSAFKEADPGLAGGFLSRAALAALEYNDSNFVKQVMEQEINQAADEVNEIANVYRTLSVLLPMFGLLGTLIGIIGVLKDLSNPETVGPAMGVAITSAFYGIFLANMVCVPIAGKIRARIWMDVRMKAMILDGVLEIMKGSIPIVVERRLQAYLG
ncbi:MAG TPA: MotA/TolQ/ExbB proton channel family protein [Elusimicrobiales bacterium]|nr:MotA/TolQ/ExbB proton channel family protein [Elusimicrobiales bacterium]